MMRKILGAAVGFLALAGTANAQEVPVKGYVGENATGGKVYDEGYLACDNSTCKIGNDVQDWNTRSGLASTGQDVTISGGVEGNAVTIDASGKLIDSGIPPGGAGGSTSINIIEQPGGVLIESDTGGDDTMAIATGTNAGAMDPDSVTKLAGVSDGAMPGDVVGPATPVDSNLAAFDTTTGKLIKDSGSAASDFATTAQGDLADTSFQVDGSTGLTLSSVATPTTTWAPVATGGTTLRANVASGSALDVLALTGTVDAGKTVKRLLSISNSSGGSVAITFSGLTVPTDYLTDSTILDGQFREYAVSTIDAGATWRLESGYLDFASLPAIGTVASGDLVQCQKVSDTPDTWRKCTAQQIADLFVGGGGGSGEANVTVDLGGGAYSVLGDTPKTGTALNHKTIAAGTGITINDTGDLLTFSTAGEANRALASQGEAQAGTDNAKGMTALRTAEAITALETGEANRALASQGEAEAGTNNIVGMTPLRTAEAIAALETGAAPLTVEVTGTSTLADPDVLQTFLVNYGMSAGGDTTLPAYSGRTKFTLLVEVAGEAWSLKPPSGEALVLDGTALDADDEIDIGQVVGDGATIIRIRTGASAYQWWFYTARGTHADGGAS